MIITITISLKKKQIYLEKGFQDKLFFKKSSFLRNSPALLE